MEGSLLDAVGEEIVGIICPVSICMLLVVMLVRKLQTEITNTTLSSIAVLLYSEDSTDSDWTKFLGALVNAGIFVVIVTAVTFLLVLLFYFRCTKCLRIYMGFAAFTVFTYMGGSVAILLIQNMWIPIDAITASIILYNFAVVGVLSVFFCRMPILFTQGYLVIVGTLVAFWFASLPEWTTWVLLVAISLYDLAAVLTPAGPLNLLVKLAMTRDEEIPALIYEARPVNTAFHSSVQVMTSNIATPGASLDNSASPPEGRRRRNWKRRTDASSERTSLFRRFFSGPSVPLLVREDEEDETSGSMQMLQNLDSEACASKLAIQNIRHATNPPSQDALCIDDIHPNSNEMVSREELGSQYTFTGRNSRIDNEQMPLVDTRLRHNMVTMNETNARLSTAEDQEMTRDTVDDVDGVGLGASGAIKLGLGDFIFYSVLVGRAALYDLTTVYACYLAIIAGLGATLALLAVWRRALPALPISIALGVMFYFLARFLMEPFVMQFGTDLIFF